MKPVINSPATARGNVEKWLHSTEHDAKPGQDEQTRNDDIDDPAHNEQVDVTDPEEEDE